MLKIKTLSKMPWPRMLRRQDARLYVKEPDWEGWIGLLLMEEVTAPITFQYGGQSVKIIDHGYGMLQIAPKGAHWWLSAYMDETGCFREYYFDITWANHLNCPEPYMEDLYLDMVLLPDGSCFELDRDELEEALEQEIITGDQRQLAMETFANLALYWPPRIEELERRCLEYTARLRPLLR